jgi:GntR family transcriptional repressor for pyruvate dehydrogenase complex
MSEVRSTARRAAAAQPDPLRDWRGEIGEAPLTPRKARQAITLKLGRVSRGPHLPMLVASSITREIAEGRLAPGDQLPTEQELAETFGVSRNVIREAIARLRSEGRVWSQQGRGAFVSDGPQIAVLKIEHDVLATAESYRSLFELRGMLEVQAAGLAADRRTTADRRAMARHIATMRRSPYGSVAWLAEDVAFHQAIAAATRNPYIIHIVGFVSERIRESILASGHQRRTDDIAALTLAEHGRIYCAVRDRDVEAAREAMRMHLTEAEKRLGLRGDEARRGKPARR